MATQIAPTPVVKGQRAKELYENLQKKPSKSTESGLKKLENMFKGVIK